MRKIKTLHFLTCKSSLFSPIEPLTKQTHHCYTQRFSYVEVKMKWKKDRYLDSLPVLDKIHDLKAIFAVKDYIIKEPDFCIPISCISKKNFELGIPIRVATFLRKYPTIFKEVTGEKYNLPWFRLTQEAIDLDSEEQAVYQNHLSDFIDRLKKLLFMTKEKRLPLQIIEGMRWYLGLPKDYLKVLKINSSGSFSLYDMVDGKQGLSLNCEALEVPISFIQQKSMREGSYREGGPIAFSLYPSKGLRLKRKIENWVEELQNLPYISPYEDPSDLNPNSDISEKRVVGVLHELLGLFVENLGERKKLLFLKKQLGLPQKFHKAFERHPHIFYLSLRNKTCHVILKEAYNKDSMIEKHPILGVRKKFMKLMDESKTVIVSKRHKKPAESDDEKDERCNGDLPAEWESGEEEENLI
ncbi:hypothetical protein AMTRI_Chr02g265530 [Amborella trichopoda]